VAPVDSDLKSSSPAPRSWRPWALPYTRTGLFVLQAAVVGGRCLGLPLPSVSRLGNTLGAAKREADALAELMSVFSELNPGATQSLGSLERAAAPGFMEADRDLLSKSAQSTLALLVKAGGENWGRIGEVCVALSWSPHRTGPWSGCTRA